MGRHFNIAASGSRGAAGDDADLVSIAPSVKNPYGDEHSPFVVTNAAKPCDDNLLGFIVNPASDADGKKLNEQYLPLAIYGYFPAKVTLENGAIKRGDAITSSSKPGYGMKATQASKIIGYALEDANVDGTIQVFANHGESAAPEVAALRMQVKSQAEQIAAQQNQIDALVRRLSAGTNGESGRHKHAGYALKARVDQYCLRMWRRAAAKRAR